MLARLLAVLSKECLSRVGFSLFLSGRHVISTSRIKNSRDARAGSKAGSKESPHRPRAPERGGGGGEWRWAAPSDGRVDRHRSS